MTLIIIIELYKGNPAILKILKSIGQENITVSIITAGELIYGALNKRELARIKKDIAHLPILKIDEAVCDKFLTLMSTYALSHQLSLPDGFIAAFWPLDGNRQINSFPFQVPVALFDFQLGYCRSSIRLTKYSAQPFSTVLMHN